MICLDTSPVIWGVRGIASVGQEEMVGKAKRYIEHLDAESRRTQRKTVMFPSPALAEYLVGSPTPEQREAERRWIEGHFMVPAFDFPAAQVAAELQDRHVMRLLQQSVSVDRDRLRVDVMILAVAITNGAEKIVTHDLRHFRRLSEGRIDVIDIPDIDIQPELFS